jgi:ketosteroid isomerase-like protein
MKIFKKLVFFVLTVTMIAACQQEQRYFAESAETKTLEAGIAAYESGDWDQWKSHFADTAKIYVNSNEPITVDERMAQFKQTTPAWADYGFDKEKAYIEMVLDKEDETWVYYWAPHNGSIKATGKELSIPVHLAVQFVDGKIVEEHVYFDGTEMNKAMEEAASMQTATEGESE